MLKQIRRITMQRRKLFRLLFSSRQKKAKAKSYFDRRFSDLSLHTYYEDVVGECIYIDDQSYVSSISIGSLDDGGFYDDEFDIEKTSSTTEETCESVSNYSFEIIYWRILPHLIFPLVWLKYYLFLTIEFLNSLAQTHFQDMK